MRRTTRLAIPVGVFALLTATAPAATAVIKDRTAPHGTFGFTTLGLGAGPQYGEPSLAVAPDGKHVAVSTPGSDGKGHGTVQIWHSSDNGNTFAHTTTTSANGGGDSELDFRPDGTLLDADLEVTDSAIQISKDYGKTWTPAKTVAGSEQDRQWFAHTPDGKREFLVYHDFLAEAEFISESDDGGKTWTHTPADQIVVDGPGQVGAPGIAVTPKRGANASLFDQGANTFSGPMLVDRNGKDFYVVYSISNLDSNANPTVGVPPFGPVRGLVVGHSGDAGKTWTDKYAVVAKPNPADPKKEEATGTFFPWGFVDPAGTVYIVYNGDRGVEGTGHYHQYYVFSKDKGKHWSKPIRLDNLPLGAGADVYNTGAAVKKGVVDFAWYQTDKGTPASGGTWSVWFAQVSHADTKHPIVKRQKVSTIPNHVGGICLQGILCGVGPGSSDRSLLDFFELGVNPKTHMANIAYADNAGQRPGKVNGEVVFAKQTKQPALPKTAVKTATPQTPGSSSTTNTGSTHHRSRVSTGALAATGGTYRLPLIGIILVSLAGLLYRRRRTG